MARDPQRRDQRQVGGIVSGTQWLLPVGVCAGVTWVALLVRFWREGRLLATRTSRWCAVAFVAWTACVAGLASFWLMPHASRVPPTLVGAIAGWALVSQVGREQERQLQNVPLLKLFTLYDSVLLERLARQLKHDEVTWCRQLARGFCESWELRSFIDDVRNILLLRVDVSGLTAHRRTNLKEEINIRYDEAVASLNKWTTQARAREKASEDPNPHVLADAEMKYRNARGQAEQKCCFLLGIAYKEGNRSTDREIFNIKTALQHDGVEHGTQNGPAPSRWVSLPRQARSRP
ncbi:hypothetical protein GCM10010252_27580 [Streptomyces aureoverticillatus]|nr:hypothetical protein GCM10010252_27580 [Streptomyces aureoverticillatus]